GVVNMPIIPSNILREEIEHFANCISRNRLSQIFSNDNDELLGAHVVTCLEAARESLSEEQSVTVKFPSMNGESVAMNDSMNMQSDYTDTGAAGETYVVEQRSDNR